MKQKGPLPTTRFSFRRRQKEQYSCNPGKEGFVLWKGGIFYCVSKTLQVVLPSQTFLSTMDWEKMDSECLLGLTHKWCL